uniref:Uncharacterized protein n=1 Tax=Arundo donax TaxID=35708 RepID=A0A0A8ZSL6_ARUDO
MQQKHFILTEETSTPCHNTDHVAYYILLRCPGDCSKLLKIYYTFGRVMDKWVAYLARRNGNIDSTYHFALSSSAHLS